MRLRVEAIIGVWFLFAVFLLLQSSACDSRGAGPVVVTGKTVYQGMAIEEVQVRVLRKDGGRWNETTSGRSGYHGSYQVRTESGTFRLEARGEIIAGGERISLEGRVDNLTIPPDVRRIDRIVIELDRVNRFP